MQNFLAGRFCIFLIEIEQKSDFTLHEQKSLSLLLVIRKNSFAWFANRISFNFR